MKHGDNTLVKVRKEKFLSVITFHDLYANARIPHTPEIEGFWGLAALTYRMQ